MIITKPPLLEGKEYVYFFLLLLTLLLTSLSFEYYNYSKLTQFDDAILEVSVLKHYDKARDGKVYSVLKLRSEKGSDFYITSDAPLKNLQGYWAKVWIKTKYLTFLEYLKGFVTKGYIISISRKRMARVRMGKVLEELHEDPNVAALYKALFLALPLDASLQKQFSALGVSHLLAISGFHLGVLAFLLLVLFRYPYIKVQRCYFPYRNRHRDLFILTAILLGGYLLFLGEVASLVRAYAMLLVGYVLHDRGLKVVSMQTLLITVLILLALWPKLFFSLGFWLSVSGVYSIFLYLRYFEEVPWYINLVAIPAWVYILMTPIALVLFGTYSIYHPLSVLWSILFTLFYPLVLLTHLLGLGTMMDAILEQILKYPITIETFKVSIGWLLPYMLLGIGAGFRKKALLVLLLLALGVTVAAVYQVA